MTDGAHALIAQLERDCRDFVDTDVSREQHGHQDNAAIGADQLNSLFAGVADEPVREVERIIGQLQAIRDLLRDEGDRVQRELARYADTSQARMEFLRRIADDLAHCRVPAHRHVEHEAG